MKQLMPRRVAHGTSAIRKDIERILGNRPATDLHSAAPQHMLCFAISSREILDRMCLGIMLFRRYSLISICGLEECGSAWQAIQPPCLNHASYCKSYTSDTYYMSIGVKI
jgi:hypothetical protein